MVRSDDLLRIEQALARAREILGGFTPGAVEHRMKAGDDPVTEADTAVNDALLETLPRQGEGWLSEETVDDLARLDCERVWIVDPLDGTREFVAGVPEWCVSVGLAVGGRPVAGGICNPVADRTVVGAVGHGVRLNGRPCRTSGRERLEGAQILASRSETRRGEWQPCLDAGLDVQPMGSVAYKLGLVAAGLADATWTLVPKNEWDVAAGAALVLAAGGEVWTPDGASAEFNRRQPRFDGFLAAPRELAPAIRSFLARN